MCPMFHYINIEHVGYQCVYNNIEYHLHIQRTVLYHLHVHVYPLL